ncbi:nitroreductase/quinone reductase family protein [Nocardia xishanensis]|uniref:nitroreductase/quinone reductase family protein n=1 Tax=Nocardia xishanensis TaxID=238964 RepID=UPI00341BA0D9
MSMANTIRLKIQNSVHRSLLSLTGGRVGKKVAGMPTLELTTVGRKSGRDHTVVLMAPVVEGDTIVIVGSRAGDAAHPAWFLNLRETPMVRVSVQHGPERSMVAHVATADERAALWPRVCEAWKGYDRYQRRTSREIPLVRLRPVA